MQAHTKLAQDNMTIQVMLGAPHAGACGKVIKNRKRFADVMLRKSGVDYAETIARGRLWSSSWNVQRATDACVSSSVKEPFEVRRSTRGW